MDSKTAVGSTADLRTQKSAAAGKRRASTARHPLPPIRFYVGIVLYAMMVVYLEKAAHISSGGVSGLSISAAHFLHVGVWLTNAGIKFLIFASIGLFAGRRTALWTMVAAVLSALCMALFEIIPLPFVWPTWLAFVLIVTVSYFPIGLMLSKGYSTGGFTAIAQAVSDRFRIPLWATITALNTFSILAMGVAFGKVSGVLTLVATAWGGFSIHLWTRIVQNVLDRNSKGETFK